MGGIWTWECASGSGGKLFVVSLASPTHICKYIIASILSERNIANLHRKFEVTQWLVMGIYRIVSISIMARWTKSFIGGAYQTTSESKQKKAIYNHWAGLVNWTGGLTLKIIFALFNKTYSPVVMWKLFSLLSAHTVMVQVRSRPTVIVKGFVASNEMALSLYLL